MGTTSCKSTWATSGWLKQCGQQYILYIDCDTAVSQSLNIYTYASILPVGVTPRILYKYPGYAGRSFSPPSMPWEPFPIRCGGPGFTSQASHLTRPTSTLLLIRHHTVTHTGLLYTIRNQWTLSSRSHASQDRKKKGTLAYFETSTHIPLLRCTRHRAS